MRPAKDERSHPARAIILFIHTHPLFETAPFGGIADFEV
jgi:hypothetical protein